MVIIKLPCDHVLGHLQNWLLRWINNSINSSHSGLNMYQFCYICRNVRRGPWSRLAINNHFVHIQRYMIKDKGNFFIYIGYWWRLSWLNTQSMSPGCRIGDACPIFSCLYPPPYALPLSCNLMLVPRLFYFSITITQNTLNLV